MLQNEYLQFTCKIGSDAAESGPSKIWKNLLVSPDTDALTQTDLRVIRVASTRSTLLRITRGSNLRVNQSKVMQEALGLYMAKLDAAGTQPDAPQAMKF